MALKNYKPTSPGLRQLVIVDRSELYKGAPEKSLTIGLTKTGGRDNFGHVTSRRIGGGHKLRESNMILTVQLSLLLSAMKMAKRLIFLLLKD